MSSILTLRCRERIVTGFGMTRQESWGPVREFRLEFGTNGDRLWREGRLAYEGPNACIPLETMTSVRVGRPLSETPHE